jgi:hypothetical protein
MEERPRQTPTKKYTNCKVGRDACETDDMLVHVHVHVGATTGKSWTTDKKILTASSNGFASTSLDNITLFLSAPFITFFIQLVGRTT